MGEGFVLSREVERYVARITSGIRKKTVRERVAEEYRAHIEDHIEEAAYRGVSAEEAMSRIREELGEERKVEELLASIHNRPPLPSWLAILWKAALLLLVLSSYFFIPSDTYRAWLLLFLQLGLGLSLLILFYTLWLYLAAIRTRRSGYRRLLAYCEKNSLQLKKNTGIYRSLFSLGTQPELILDTPESRYLLYLFPTVKRRKTLRLLEGGLYSYWDNVGYMYLYTRHTALFGPSWFAFVPKGVKPFPSFHSDMCELPRGMHLIPEIDWQQHELLGKDTVRVYLLSPVPMKLIGVERGVARPMNDDASFDGQRIWSFSGLISYLEGLRISGKRHIAG